jgi:hypothetical protein
MKQWWPQWFCKYYRKRRMRLLDAGLFMNSRNLLWNQPL